MSNSSIVPVRTRVSDMDDVVSGTLPYPLIFGHLVESHRTPGATDTQAVNAAIAAAVAAGGGTVVFGPKVYTLTSRIRIPVSADPLPRQHFIRLTGSGRTTTVTNSSAYGGTILDFGGIATNDGGYGCIESLGCGHFEIDRLTLANSGTVTDPFIYATNTVLHVEQVTFEGNPSLLYTACNQDAIQLGSTTSSATTTGSQTSAFQGYGTVIRGNLFQNIRRGVYCGVYSNGSVIRDNTWGVTCGGSSSYGAIEVMGLSAAQNDGSQPALTDGLVISGNLIEAPGYIYGVRLSPYSGHCFVSGNTMWDGGVAVVYIDNNSSGHVLISGANPGGVPFVASADANYGRKNIIIDQKYDGTSGIVVGGIGIGHAGTVAEHGQVNLINDTAGNIGFGTASPAGRMHVKCSGIGNRGLVIEAAPGQQVPPFEIRHADGTPGVYVDAADELFAPTVIATNSYWSESGAPKWNVYVNGGLLRFFDYVHGYMVMSFSPGTNPATAGVTVNAGLTVAGPTTLSGAIKTPFPTVVTPSAGTATVDCSLNNLFSLSITGATALVLTNLDKRISIRITNTGGSVSGVTATNPASGSVTLTPAGGSIPALTGGGKADWITFMPVTSITFDYGLALPNL